MLNLQRKMKVRELVDFLENELKITLTNLPNLEELEVTEIDQARPDTFNWSNTNKLNWEQINAGILIVPRNSVIPQNHSSCIIKVDNPRMVFAKVLQNFFSKENEPKICTSAIIGEGCEIEKNVSVGANCIIGDNVTIKSGTKIEHNVTIYDNSFIDSGCILKIGCKIGGEGFGFEKINEENLQIPHIGNVYLSKRVQIGSYSCVDRGTIGTTFIGDGVKIDDHSFIGHNVKISQNVIICSHVTISGSVTIGENAYIAPGVSIRNAIKIGESSVLGMGAVVIKHVEDGATVIGNPAQEFKREKLEKVK